MERNRRLRCPRVDCERQARHAFDAAGYESAPDRNAPAATVDANATASRRMGRRLRRTNVFRNLAEVDLRAPDHHDQFGLITRRATARQKELFWSSVLRTEKPIGPV